MKKKIVLVMFVCVCLFTLKLSAYGQNIEDNTLNFPIWYLKLKQVTLQEALNQIALDFNTPIGLELIEETDISSFSNTFKLDIDLENGTLKDVFNLLAQKNTAYTWTYVDGVVNFYPVNKQNSILSDILSTKIDSFLVEPGTTRAEIRSGIISLPGVKEKLKRENIKPYFPVSFGNDFREVKKDFSLLIKDTTIRGILNEIARKSVAKFWVVNIISNEDKRFILGL